MAAAGVLNGAATAENQPRSTTTSSVSPRLTRAESNRRNSQRSTGPRTQAGKEKVRFNGLKHGMTARSTVLPGEDPARFEAARRQLHDDLAPRDALEAILVDRIALATWQANRDDQVARARREAELEHHALDQAATQNRQVIALGQLLLEDLSQPMHSRPAARRRRRAPGPTGGLARIHHPRLRLALGPPAAARRLSRHSHRLGRDPRLRARPADGLLCERFRHRLSGRSCSLGQRGRHRRNPGSRLGPVAGGNRRA